MSASLLFELVAPEKLLFSKQVAMVTVPGEEGFFGVLEGHAPVIASLKAGVVDICEKEAGTISERLFVAGGFAEVTATSCTVLAEEAVPLSEIKRDAVEAEITKLTADLAASAESDRAALESRLGLAQAKLEAVR